MNFTDKSDTETMELDDEQFPMPDLHTWYDMTTIFCSKLPMLYKRNDANDTHEPFHGGTLFIRKHQDTQATYCALQLSNNKLAMIHSFKDTLSFPWVAVQSDGKQYVAWFAFELINKEESQFSCCFPTLQESKKLLRAMQDAIQYSSETDEATISKLIRDHKL